mgnify:CR=1 FL=1
MIVIPLTLVSQENKKIFTSDIDNFWKAYDRIQTTNEYPDGSGMLARICNPCKTISKSCRLKYKPQAEMFVVLKVL